jgi:hypothetical protein
MQILSLRLRVLAICALLFPCIATAQIVLTQSDASAILAAGKTYDSHVDTSRASVNIGSASSSAQTWNFAARNYGSSYTETYINPTSTPFTGLFPSANVGTYTKDSSSAGKLETYTYGQLINTDYLSVGSVTRASGTAHDTTMVDSLKPAQSVIKLPLQYNMSWSYKSLPQITSFVLGYATKSTRSVDNAVDAFGTVSVPGKTFDALRLKSTEIDTIQTIIAGIVYSTQVNTFTSYVWLAKDGSSASVSVSGSEVSYSLPSSGATSVEHIAFDGPSTFSLEQNYPNPFNPSTNIEFEIQDGGRTTLSVFNILGQEVATLVDRYMPAGRYRVTFNANDLPSGPYIYSVQSGGTRTARKIMLVK